MCPKRWTPLDCTAVASRNGFGEQYIYIYSKKYYYYFNAEILCVHGGSGRIAVPLSDRWPIRVVDGEPEQFRPAIASVRGADHRIPIAVVRLPAASIDGV